jgi:glycosyltransferase involved in cell wall biosynthesis
VASPETLPPQPVPDRIKVLHLITRFLGGAGGNTLLSAAGMDRSRYETWVAAADGGPLWERAEEAEVRTARIPHLRERIAPVDDAIALWEVFCLIRRERFSVVHTHTSKAGFIGRLAASLAGSPVVVHTLHAFAAHDFMPASRRIIYRALDRLARGLGDQYIAVAPRVAREAVETKLVRPGSIVVVPSAVEMDQVPDRTDHSVRRELAIADDRPVVGWVGRMVSQKAPLDFVRMAAIVQRSHPEAAFVMVGDGSLEARPLEKQTRAEARRLGVDVVFTGFRSDAPRIASAFDVYVVCSLYEGLGRGLTEAMASGRAVVATAVNGVPDLVEPGATGLLAEPSDPGSLASCVRWMLDHPTERRRMGIQARAMVSGVFDQATMCDALDRLYRRLLGLGEQGPRNQQPEEHPPSGHHDRLHAEIPSGLATDHAPR